MIHCCKLAYDTSVYFRTATAPVYSVPQSNRLSINFRIKQIDLLLAQSTKIFLHRKAIFIQEKIPAVHCHVFLHFILSKLVRSSVHFITKTWQ